METEEQWHSKAKFSDLVKFIETQVKILTDPVFSNIHDTTVNPCSTKAKRSKLSDKQQLCHHAMWHA